MNNKHGKKEDKMKDKKNRTIFITIILLVTLILLIASTFNNNVVVTKEPKAKMLVGKLCLEVDETPEQFRAKQDLWAKAFGFVYVECK